MAMNKKEQAEMDSLKKQLLRALALHHTSPVKPDVSLEGLNARLNNFDYNSRPLTSKTIVTRGYYVGNVGDVVVCIRAGISSGCTQGDMDERRFPTKTSSQNTRDYYSCKSDALRQARYLNVERMLDLLVNCDERIAKAEEEEANSEFAHMKGGYFVIEKGSVNSYREDSEPLTLAKINPETFEVLK